MDMTTLSGFVGYALRRAQAVVFSDLSEALMLDHRYDNVRVSYIMPGSVDTEFGAGTAGLTDWKIAPADVAQVVINLLRMPERTLVSRIEMRPLKPRK